MSQLNQFKDSVVSFFNNIIKNMDKNTILTGVAVIVIIIAGAATFMWSSGYSLSDLGLGFGLSNDRIAKKAISYINDNGIAQGAASLVNVSEESGLVKIKIKIGDNEFDSYATRDGKLLFPTALKMDEK